MSSEDTRDRPWAEAADHNRRLVDEFVARPKVAMRPGGTAARSAVESLIGRVDELGRERDKLDARILTLAKHVERIGRDTTDYMETNSRRMRESASERWKLESRIIDLESRIVPWWMAVAAWAAGGASMILLKELWEAIR